MGIYEISLATVVGINIILALGLNMISGFWDTPLFTA